MSMDMLEGPRQFVRVYRLPETLTGGYCFNGGVEVGFQNVDWFECPLDMTPTWIDLLDTHVRLKNYFSETHTFLILAENFVKVIGRPVTR